MILTKEQALEYHRWMWYDMQIDLGDCPDIDDRLIYQHRWCKEKSPQEQIIADCVLCEYALQAVGNCDGCPIDWGYVVRNRLTWKTELTGGRAQLVRFWLYLKEEEIDDSNNM